MSPNVADSLRSRAQDYRALAETEEDLAGMDGGPAQHHEAARTFTIVELILRELADVFEEAA